MKIVAPLLSTMSYQDELSQLMPSLYSKVQLAYGSDNTADLAQYANNHAIPVSSALLISPAAEQNCQPCGPTGAEQLPLQPVLNMKPRIQQGLSQRLGTGRTVAHRAFDLMLRYDCSPAAWQDVTSAHHRRVSHLQDSNRNTTAKNSGH